MLSHDWPSFDLPNMKTKSIHKKSVLRMFMLIIIENHSLIYYIFYIFVHFAILTIFILVCVKSIWIFRIKMAYSHFILEDGIAIQHFFSLPFIRILLDFWHLSQYYTLCKSEFHNFNQSIVIDRCKSSLICVFKRS